MIKISVIIPVYNVEKYLRQCLDSVINQTYKNLEIICIDDCSTDNSFQILKEYEKIDDRIKIYKNDQNIKAGLTRNRGLELATGEYIHFLDSDDWLELDAYEKLINIIEKKGNIDIVHFLCQDINSTTGKFTTRTYNMTKGVEEIINIYNTSDLAIGWQWAPWCKLHRRNFLLDNKIEFNNYPSLEDMEHSIQVLVKAKSVYLINDVLINYRTNNSNSLMGKCYKYQKYAIKSYHNILKFCTDLPQETKIKLLNIELYEIIKMFYSNYICRYTSLSELKSFINSLDLSPFGNNIIDYKWYIYYHDIMTNPELLVKLKYYMRNYLKMYLPFIHDIIVKIRRKFKILKQI